MEGVRLQTKLRRELQAFLWWLLETHWLMRQGSRRDHDRTPRQSSTRRQERDEHSSQPIAIYSRSRTRYHGEGSTHHSSDRYASPPDSRASQPSETYETASGYKDDWPQSTTRLDPLVAGVKGLTMADLGEADAHYKTVSTSAPSGQSHWGPVSSVSYSNAPVIQEDSRAQIQWSAGTIPTENTGSYQDKGKGISSDPPQQYSSQPRDPRHVAGTTGDTERFDKNYRVRNTDYKKFFSPGRVFSTLWTDAFSVQTNDSENKQWASVTYVVFGQQVHSKIRRFVVVKQEDLYCTCLPVTTYDGRGYTKRGIKIEDHGLIYSSKDAPPRVKGMDKESLRVVLSPKAEKIVNPSYINYGRAYTVETNVKVRDVGELDSSSRRRLVKYYNKAIVAAADPDSDDPDDTIPPQAKAVELAHVGGAVGGPAQTYSTMQPAYGTSGPSHGAISSDLGYVAPSGYAAPGYKTSEISSTAAGHPVDSSYYHAGSTTQPLSYSTRPVYDPRQSSSSDPRYPAGSYITDAVISDRADYSTSSSTPHVAYGSGPVLSYSSSSREPVSSVVRPEEGYQSQQQFGGTAQYASSSGPATSGSSGAEYRSSQAQEEIILPTIEESRAQSSRHRRDSNTARPRPSGRSNTDSRGRPRDGERERDRNRDDYREVQRRR